MHVGFWSIVGLAFIVVMLVAIVCLIVGLFRRADEMERREAEEWEREFGEYLP